ncbi:DUF676-domain-containing protein [Gigaspora margarita]|uniref:DUF676-domain-containing protein n=1 Tax=Gigaspora margarita TaxID=4874 RepID=A0A8H3X0Y4_GIGMA|nr:DUF676-domain-containing protein [Gigaspora margarita]
MHPSSTAWPPSNLLVRITNETSILFRGAVLSGPYNISASCVETEHANKLNLLSDHFFTPNLKPSIKCGEVWEFDLKVPSNGFGDWTIDIICEILFSLNKEEATIDDELQIFDGDAIISQDRTTVYSPSIKYEFLKPHGIFKLPDLTTFSTKDIHLVVLTHGINGSMLDELYLKEAIEKKCIDQKLIMPFFLCLIVTNGAFFNYVQPIHFITIATPWLGSTDLSWYIKVGLKFGVVGQTGKYLALIDRSKEEQEKA